MRGDEGGGGRGAVNDCNPCSRRKDSEGRDFFSVGEAGAGTIRETLGGPPWGPRVGGGFGRGRKWLLTISGAVWEPRPFKLQGDSDFPRTGKVVGGKDNPAQTNCPPI